MCVYIFIYIYTRVKHHGKKWSKLQWQGLCSFWEILPPCTQTDGANDSATSAQHPGDSTYSTPSALHCASLHFEACDPLSGVECHWSRPVKARLFVSGYLFGELVVFQWYDLTVTNDDAVQSSTSTRSTLCQRVLWISLELSDQPFESNEILRPRRNHETIDYLDT